MADRAIHVYVTGKVQGVWFRANTQRKAQELQLTGWVKNLADGRVECMIFGTEEQVEKMIQWLWQGPELATVSDVIIQDIPQQNKTSFDIL